MLIATAAGAVGIGLALGLLGGGGSILAVPLLVYVAHLEPKQAIATSLFVIAVTSAAATVPHARAGRVSWRTGVVFGGAAMAGAYGGGRLAAFVPGGWLLVAFGVMMIATAAAMIRGRRSSARRGDDFRTPLFRMLSYGVAVGVVTGLVGAGGGFLVVPALTLLGGLPMGTAVGTSLLVIAMNSVAGLAGHLATMFLDWRLVLTVTLAAIGGSVVGEFIAGRIPQRALRVAFGWFVLASGVVFLVIQTPPELRQTAGVHPLFTAMAIAGTIAGALATVMVTRRTSFRSRWCRCGRRDVRGLLSGTCQAERNSLRWFLSVADRTAGLVTEGNSPRRWDRAAEPKREVPTRDGGLWDFRPCAVPQGLHHAEGMDSHEARAEVLSRPECLALLASVPVGRIVYTDAGLPAIQPVNFILHQGNIVIRTGQDTRLAKAAEDAVVAFEVDEIDVESESGWSVVVTGRSHGVWETAEVQALGRLSLRPWAPGCKDHFLRIRPEFVSGRRIRGEGAAPARGAYPQSAQR